MEKERWRLIQDYEKMYRVSNFGNIQHRNKSGSWEKHFKTKNKNGYFYTILAKNGKKKTYKVARLVAIAWIPNPKNKRTVNHKSFNRLDDSMTNLEWMTYQENARHAFAKEGRKIPDRSNENHPSHRLTWAIVNKARESFLKNFRKINYQKELAKKIGVTANYLNLILCNHVWVDPSYKSPSRKLKGKHPTKSAYD